MVFIWMQLEGVSVLDFPNDLEIRGALRGVVTMVAFTPREANSFAMYAIGIMWPGAIRGNNSMCSWRCSLPIFLILQVRDSKKWGLVVRRRKWCRFSCRERALVFSVWIQLTWVICDFWKSDVKRFICFMENIFCTRRIAWPKYCAKF